MGVKALGNNLLHEKSCAFDVSTNGACQAVQSFSSERFLGWHSLHKSSASEHLERVTL